MLFNSVEFAVFLPITFFLYWFVFRYSIRFQNIFLISASYFFYGWWDWRFLSLIVLSSLVDFFIGLWLEKSTELKIRKIFLALSLCLNLGLLGYFKYCNFFIDNFIQAFQFFRVHLDQAFWVKIVLPVGISFYTFQTLSYTIDVYRKKISACHDPVQFFAYVCFFPQLVAGPIERATQLLPQFKIRRFFDQHLASDGCRQILLGLFKKIVIADNCAWYVKLIFDDPSIHSGSTLLLGAFYFTFQIYGDFSGYSDIAIGTAKLFGFSLSKNFATPYFSRDIAEFWRRWHISLSTWFRDYVYIPLGGSRGGVAQKAGNVFTIFLLSGFWHGANWTFVVWGLMNAIYFMPLMLRNKNRIYVDDIAPHRLLPNVEETFFILRNFILVMLTWIMFRAESLGHAFEYYSNLFSPTILSYPKFLSKSLIALIILLLGLDWAHRNRKHSLDISLYLPQRPLRWITYYSIVALLVFFGAKSQDFIYFQF